MNAPQVIILCLDTAAFFLVLNQHGKPKGNYNIFAMAFATALHLGLLYWGGFFK